MALDDGTNACDANLENDTFLSPRKLEIIPLVKFGCDGLKNFVSFFYSEKRRKLVF